MEVVRSIDPEKQIAYTTITGKITLAEIRAEMAKLPTLPGFNPLLPGLIDLRQATVALTGDDIRQIADAIKARPDTFKGTRRALLVNSDLMFGLYRMFATFASDSEAEYRIFREEKQAHEWLEKLAKSLETPKKPAS